MTQMFPYDTVYRLNPLGNGLVKHKHYGPVPIDAHSVHRKHYIPERQYDDSKIFAPKRPQSQYKVNYRGVCIWVMALVLIAVGGAIETQFGVDPIIWACAALVVLGITALDTLVKEIKKRGR